MTMRSPIVAMLWENWRLSRNEAAQRLAQGIVAASAALTFFDADATIAFWILIATHAFFWFSIAKLNGGRFMDGYKPGFPLYLLYSRPVPTVTIVGVAMVYDAVSCTAFYLVSAAFLRFAFGPALPLFSMTVFLMAYHFACTCVQWSTRNRVVQWIGSMVTFFPFLALLKNRMASPLQVEFSLLDNMERPTSALHLTRVTLSLRQLGAEPHTKEVGRAEVYNHHCLRSARGHDGRRDLTAGSPDVCAAVPHVRQSDDPPIRGARPASGAGPVLLRSRALWLRVAAGAGRAPDSV